jgi:hypothetical protein
MAGSLVLLFAAAGFGQGTFTFGTTTLPATIFDSSTNVLDSLGNLVVIDSGAFISNTTTTASNGQTITAVTRSPRTRITIVRTASTETAVYNASFQLLGVGQAIYGVFTTVSGTIVTRTLVAIKTTLTLPQSLTGFPSFLITDFPEIRQVAPDSISLVTPPLPPNSPAIRTAEVVTFNGSTFVAQIQRSIP